MSFLSAVAGDGKGNITNGKTADRYIDKMNEVRHNVATSQFKKIDSAEEQKVLSTQFVDEAIRGFEQIATPEEKINAFNYFRNQNKPV